jgi:tetratricopeptide (TPR) repeat protein
MNPFQLPPIVIRTLLIVCCWLATASVNAQTPKTSSAPPLWGDTAVNAFLTAELLALDSQYEAAANTLWPLARYIKDPELYERVAQWAIQAKRMDLAYSAAAQWESLDPAALKPQQLADGILLLTERYSQFGGRIAARYGKAAIVPKPLELVYLQSIVKGLSLSSAQQAQVYAVIQDALRPHLGLGEVQYTLAMLAKQAALNKESAEHLRAASLALPPSTAAIGALLQTEPAQATLSALHWTQRDPKNLDAWRTLGLVYAQLKRPVQAAQAFSQGLKLDPKDVPLLLERMEQLKFAGQSNAARESLLAAYAARTSLTQAVPARLLAEQLEDDYYMDKALEVFALAQTLAKESDDQNLIQARISAIKARQGDRSSLAALLALQAKASDATVSSFTRIATSTLRELGQFDQALTLAKSLPGDEAAYEMALCYEHMGQAKQSEDLLRDALSRNPKAPHLLNTLGYGLIDRNTSPEALLEGTRLLETALEASPESAAIMDSLGWAYFRAKAYAKAKPLLQAAYDLKRDPEVAAHLGELLHATGNALPARKVWAQALALDPKHKVLNSTLKRLNIKLSAP